MRTRRKTILIKTDSKGEPMFCHEEMEAFLKMHPNKNIVMRLDVVAGKPSEKQRNYYFGYVCREVQEVLREAYGERKSIEQVDRWLRSQCPTCYIEGEVKVERYRSIDELDTAEFVDFVDWLQWFMAENFNKIIDAPD